MRVNNKISLEISAHMKNIYVHFSMANLFRNFFKYINILLELYNSQFSPQKFRI